MRPTMARPFLARKIAVDGLTRLEERSGVRPNTCSDQCFWSILRNGLFHLQFICW